MSPKEKQAPPKVAFVFYAPLTNRLRKQTVERASAGLRVDLSHPLCQKHSSDTDRMRQHRSYVADLMQHSEEPTFMNQKALKTLEYTKIIAQLESHAASPLGKALCRDLVPSSDLEEVRTWQAQTTDAADRVRLKGTVSFSGLRDIGSSLKRLEIGSALSISELLSISSVLTVAARAKAYGRQDVPENTFTPRFPGQQPPKQTAAEEYVPDSLDPLFQALEPLTPVNNEIKRCILSEDEIADDASPGLSHVRRSLKACADRIHTQLNSILNSHRTYLQDAVITMRDGRYCLPVKSEYKSQVSGMVHDQSATGSTLFIEPIAIVKLNNEIRELEIQEQKEIETVLASLSNQTAPHIEELQMDMALLAQLDFIFAKAALSHQYRCTAPIFNDKGYINIKDGRHPLLDQKKAVPINVWLGKDFDLLIVTGPNTGGKTVSLKTIGLFTLMGQAGLHIPAWEGSELAVFDNVFADIGDEQSIEQSLSTFSSHMTNIVSFLHDVDENSLVLFDELGAGTDPTEGAALAIAILSYLHGRGIRTMATTHYSELKVYALSTPGVENACCEFDVESLRPTYRLLIGIPGKSNAFAISGKLGLPDYIIEDAKTRLSEQDVSFEDLISDLETSKRTIEKEQEEIAAYKKEIEALKSQAQQKQERIEEQRERILAEAREKANTILRDAKDVADETIKNFRKFGKENISAAEMEKERERLRKKMKENTASSSLKVQKPKKEYKPTDFKLGESVKVLSMNLTGTISSLPDSRGNVTVQMGILRSQVHISDLEIIEEANPYAPKSFKRTSKGKLKMSKSLSVSPEINLLGKTVDEAVSELDKYLDDALLSHLSTVRVVHGKGTGALRKGIHEFLRRQKHVKSYRLGEFGEGDAGVTIVELK